MESKFLHDKHGCWSLMPSIVLLHQRSLTTPDETCVAADEATMEEQHWALESWTNATCSDELCSVCVAQFINHARRNGCNLLRLLVRIKWDLAEPLSSKISSKHTGSFIPSAFVQGGNIGYMSLLNFNKIRLVIFIYCLSLVRLFISRSTVLESYYEIDCCRFLFLAMAPSGIHAACVWGFLKLGSPVFNLWSFHLKSVAQTRPH